MAAAYHCGCLVSYTELKFLKKCYQSLNFTWFSHKAAPLGATKPAYAGKIFLLR